MKLKMEAKNHKSKDFIPCLYVEGKSSKVLIHFHANGEDIGLTVKLMMKLSQKLKLNIICMEYPGYGIYQDYSFKDNTT
jgi:abhydrolase domain-containing protein 17